MLNASQNYITTELNCNKYIQDKVYINDNISNTLPIANMDTFHYYCYNSEFIKYFFITS